MYVAHFPWLSEVVTIIDISPVKWLTPQCNSEGSSRFSVDSMVSYHDPVSNNKNGEPEYHHSEEKDTHDNKWSAEAAVIVCLIEQKLRILSMIASP